MVASVVDGPAPVAVELVCVYHVESGISFSGLAHLNRAVPDADFAPASGPAIGKITDASEDTEGLNGPAMVCVVDLFPGTLFCWPKALPGAPRKEPSSLLVGSGGMIMGGESTVVIDETPYAPLSQLLKTSVADVVHALGRPRLLDLEAAAKL